MFEKKYEILVLRREYSTVYLLFKKQTNTISPIMDIGSHTYHLSVDKPSFNRKLTKVYMVDFDTGNQFVFEEIKAVLNPKQMDLLYKSELVKQLTAGALSDKKQRLIDMVLGGIIGALLAAVLMFFYMQSQIQEIYASMNTGFVIP